ncbi:hypothetical protein K491DRAFT_590896 [Lophiostoma macrostomum CBS 122681]|uniref:Tetratricopeptide SHNi-TPR domain-containing protein n=1 Tax=Lophiostoma macrostomum CBS 122681 TaxID=1314788 RepID=A0A6A6TIH7_9PLEO|nr:hypothetical protein K491DRAFT_590896 [Lophiostoma macrostomum CBS 122681]
MAEPAADTIPRTKEKLAELTSAAALQYSLKNFAASADNYADATEIQAELNGEMAPENAELLFYYGRALHQVAIQKSDVLGEKVAKEENKKPKASKKSRADNGEGSSAPANGAANTEPKEATVDSKPFFQLTGDENWTDSEDADSDVDQGAEEEQNDLQDAYEIFEIARVLYTKQLEALESSNPADKGKGKAELTPEARAIKVKLADCYSFLAEILMENETFHDAVTDLRKSVELQEELHPLEHDHVIEAHYSLSLALEFASVRKVREGQTGGLASSNEAESKEEEQEIDYELRKEAVTHTELCVQGLEARLQTARGALAQDNITPEKTKELEFLIKDKSEVLDDMKARLADLRADPKSQEYNKIDDSVFRGVLEGLLGADSATQKAKLQEVKNSANDVTSLVKPRKKEKAAATTQAEAGSSKRKLEVDQGTDNGKRAKTEEIP